MSYDSHRWFIKLQTILIIHSEFRALSSHNMQWLYFVAPVWAWCPRERSSYPGNKHILYTEWPKCYSMSRENTQVPRWVCTWITCRLTLVRSLPVSHRSYLQWCYALSLITDCLWLHCPPDALASYPYN